MFSLMFLEFGTLWFWILFIIVALMVTIFSEDSPIKATLLAGGFILLMAWVGNISPLAMITQHGFWSALAIFGYFVIGVVWSLVKWKFYVMSQRRKIDLLKIQHREAMELNRKLYQDRKNYDFAEEALSVWLELCRKNSISDRAPKVSEHKAQIIGWMSYWPVSLVWTMINDPVRRAFVAIYDALGTSFQKISDNAFRDINKEEPWKTKEEYPL